MFTPVIKEFHSSLSPWEIFRSVYQHHQSGRAFFLDSIRYELPDQRYSYIGADPFLEIQLLRGKIHLSGADKGVYAAAAWQEVFREIFQKYQTRKDPAFDFFTGGAVGYWGYECAALFEDIRFRKKSRVPIPEFYFGFYRDLIVYDHKLHRYYLVVLKASRESNRSIENRQEKLEDYFKSSAVDLDEPPVRVIRFKPEMTKKQFVKTVGRIQEFIAAGDIYQANFSQRFQFRYEGNPLKLYSDLRTINPSPFASFLKIGDTQILSSSPERLIRKIGRHCETRPIAGTRPRQSIALSSKELEKDLLHNEKERAEHIMLVDLERNDLGRICDFKSIRVEEMMTIERYSHVIHIVSKIIGRLRRDKDGWDLIRAMFPGGTITGCPKIRCMQIIDQLEPVERGIYTGSIGVMDFNGDLDLNIVIRTLLLNGSTGYLQTGAGIVYDSDPVKEYEETLHKGEALVAALVQSNFV